MSSLFYQCPKCLNLHIDESTLLNQSKLQDNVMVCNENVSTFDVLDIALCYICQFCHASVLQCLHCKFASINDQNRSQYYMRTHARTTCNRAKGEVENGNDAVAAQNNDIWANNDSGGDGNNDNYISADIANEKDDDGSINAESYFTDDSPDTINDEDDISDDFVCGNSDDESNLSVTEMVEKMDIDNNGNDGGDVLVDQSMHLLNKFEELFGQNSVAATYFWQQAQLFEYSGRRTGGLQGVVQRCISQVETYELCDLDTTILYFLLLQLLHDLKGKAKQISLMHYTRALVDRMTLDQPADVPLPVFPMSFEESKKRITGPKHAMISNLPIEPILPVDGMHVRISVDYCIDAMMANGTRPIFAQDEKGIRNFEGLNGCPFVCEMVDKIRSELPNPNTTAIGWVSTWSDGYLTSFIKQFLNSAWLMTLTVSSPAGRRSASHTHIVALGPSKRVSHDEVVTEILTEIVGLRHPKKRYCGRTNQWFDTVFFFLVYSGDRPEKNERTHTSLLGQFTKRFMFSAVTDLRFLPSCRVCAARRHRFLLGIEDSGNHICEGCCDWEFSSTPNSLGWRHSAKNISELLGTTSAGNQKYPTTTSPGHTPFPTNREIPEQSHIRPIKQTFADLTKAVVLSFEQVALGQWYQYNLNAYLRSCGINARTRNAVYEAAKEASEELQAIQNEDEKRDRLNQMLELDHLIEIGVVPAIWAIEGLLLDMFPELPMHLIFSGITNDLFTLMEQFMITNSHKNAFEKFINLVQSGLCQWQLSFAKQRPLPTSRFVSENYLSLARHLPWMMSLYFLNWDLSKTPHSHRVALQRLINAGFVLISHLMKEEEVNIAFLEASIKTFLSCWNDVEIAIGNLPSSISLWSKGNHLSLLNLIEQVRRFGNVRLLWEGNNELIIQLLKKLQKNGLRLSESYFRRIMKKHLREKWINLVNNELMEAGLVDNTRQNYKEKLYQRFKKGELEKIFSKGRVISCLMLKDDFQNVYAVESFRRDSNETLRKITVTGQEGYTAIGLTYTTFELSHDRIQMQRTRLEETCIPCLLLPLARKKKSFDGKYTIITSDWKVLQHDGTIDFPRHCPILFKE